ncbi:MAG TPA: alpha-amylase family protein [Verrucomicrobiae bacterium]
MPHRTNRRKFLTTAAGSSLGALAGSCLSAQGASDASESSNEAGSPASASAAIPASRGVATKFWIDPSIAAWQPGPWRKVHIEFHNSRHMPKLGERFNADEFGDRLLDAHVTGATVFAKDMYGYCYYPSSLGPMHPGLSFDMLGAQVAALRKRKIQVLAYYMTTLNPQLAGSHPEWLNRPPASPASKSEKAVDREYNPWEWSFSLAQEDYVKEEFARLKELVSRYELDGVWLDGIGADAASTSFLKRAREVIKETRPACLVCPQNQGSFYGLAQRAPFVDYSSQEALFTDAQHYGYHYFPTVIRYARGHGIPFHGCTVIFKDFWADFGGLKSPAQMHTEVAAYVSQGARCDIGDQIHPNGQLDPAVYHVIGQAYQHMERLEPYLDQAVPVTEAALLASGDAPCNEVNYGWVKLLNESKIQFDIVERDVKWEYRYMLVVLPEDLWVDQALASRLQAFIAAGGGVIAAHRSGLLAGTERSWLESYGLHYAGMSPFTPAYMVPRVNFTGGIPSYAYALYEGASQWRAESPAATLAALGEPLFQRSPEHYNSHLQTPFDHTSSYAALARSGRVALISFPLGQGYYNQGFWIYRQAFQKVLSEVLPVPLIQSDAHLSTELSLTHQAAKPGIGRKDRYLVHIVNYSPVRKTPKHTDFYDDPVPLNNVTVRLNLPLKVSKAKALYAGQTLPVRHDAGGGLEVLVPRVDIHEVLCFEPS